MNQDSPMADPFGLGQGRDWTLVSRQLVAMRHSIQLFLSVPIVIIAVLLIRQYSSIAAYIVLTSSFILALSIWWIIDRNWRSWGFAERADDLLITHGALFKKLVIVPYGRMQLVDVQAGPIERIFGVTKVKLHTAAATTDAKIIGLEPQVAFELRDRLARLGEARAAGL